MTSTKTETSEFWYDSDDPHVYNGIATFYVTSSYYVSHSGIMNWNVQEIQTFLDRALAFIDSNESALIDRKNILLIGKNVLGETLSVRYQRPATPEEEDAYRRRQEEYKQERRERLLAELAELDEEHKD